MAILVGAASALMLTMNLILALVTVGFMAFIIWRSAAEVPTMVRLYMQGQQAIGRMATVVKGGAKMYRSGGERTRDDPPRVPKDDRRGQED